MAEMRISSTLVNDDASQTIAYAEQIKDRATYKNLGLVNPSMHDIAVALDKMKGGVIEGIKCSTTSNATTAVKDISIDNFKVEDGKPLEGTILMVKFPHGNNASDIGVNINATGVIPIYISGQPFSYSCSNDTILTLMYDKTSNRFDVVGGADNFTSAWE